MPSKARLRTRLSLPSALRLHKLLYPFEHADPAPVLQRVKAQQLVEEMLRNRHIRLRMSEGRPRKLWKKRKPVTEYPVRVTRLGRARILANLPARKGRFEDIGRYFDHTPSGRHSRGKVRSMKVKSQVAIAYIVDLMFDLAEARYVEIGRRKKWKTPDNYTPVFSKKEVMDRLEGEKLTREDLNEAAIRTAERLKHYERPPRFDDLSPNVRRYQGEREVLINFAQYMLHNNLIWSKVKEEFAKLWKEASSLSWQEKIGRRGK